MNTRKKTILESFFGVLMNTCPRCFGGAVFSRLLTMNQTCPKCQLKYEREPGYFLAAMSLSYSMGFVVVLPIFLFLLFRDLSLLYVVGIPGVILVMLAPITFRLSRLIWLHFDFRINPQEFEKN
ncbi:MAG: DUF983 domain-containing protein [Deltaproteobacteria bacterium]|nr:DUF983 domain-containing protein [Deltaproteobacteria bacterium]